MNEGFTIRNGTIHYDIPLLNLIDRNKIIAYCKLINSNNVYDYQFIYDKGKQAYIHNKADSNIYTAKYFIRKIIKDNNKVLFAENRAGRRIIFDDKTINDLMDTIFFNKISNGRQK